MRIGRFFSRVLLGLTHFEGGKVKPFSGGRTPDEKKLFGGINSKYTDLKEVDAVSSATGNYASKQRGTDRYM